MRFIAQSRCVRFPGFNIALVPSGVIERAWGRRLAPDNTHVFLCGSPQMAQGMIGLLAADGFTEDTRQAPGQIHVEKYWQ